MAPGWSNICAPMASVTAHRSRLTGWSATWSSSRAASPNSSRNGSPKKKRYDEVQLCLDIVRDALGASGREVEVRAKHLYHDREEITVFARSG